MRWFKHTTFANQDTKLVQVKNKLGIAGYGVYWILVERIASGSVNNSCSEISLELPIKEWATLCCLSVKKFRRFIDFYVDIHLFSISLQNDMFTIKCPSLLKYLDTYTQRSFKTKKPKKLKKAVKPKAVKPKIVNQPESKIFLKIPLVGSGDVKTFHNITEEDIKAYNIAYPGIDVPQEIRKIEQWNIANPTRRKTKTGIKRHIIAWLGRAQDKRGGQQYGKKTNTGFNWNLEKDTRDIIIEPSKEFKP